MGKKYGFSFSLSRLIGLAALKGKISRSTGIPLTKLGRERKIGQFILDKVFGKKH